jgi:hypothetical protein
MSRPKLFEKEDPKEELRGAAIIVALIGIMVLADWVLYNVRGPFIALFAIIGNVLENIFRNIALPVILAIILFIMSGILGFGLLLEDEDDIDIYKTLVEVLWSTAFSVFIILSLAYEFVSIPLSAVIGLSFVLFISPPFVFKILKGLTFLYKR